MVDILRADAYLATSVAQLTPSKHLWQQARSCADAKGSDSFRDASPTTLVVIRWRCSFSIRPAAFDALNRHADEEVPFFIALGDDDSPKKFPDKALCNLAHLEVIGSPCIQLERLS